MTPRFGAAAAIPDEQLWAAVAALPDKQRTAVALRFVADSAYAEIATTMEISEPAARRNVHEGLKRLREERTR
jgi:RNA polymerase sigma factor (sigma-70 family)